MNNYGLKDRRNTPLPPLGGLPQDPNIPRAQHDMVSPGSSGSGINSGSSQSGISAITQYSQNTWAGANTQSPYSYSSVNNTPAPLNTSHQYDHKPASFDSSASSNGYTTLARPSPMAASPAESTLSSYGQHSAAQQSYPALYSSSGPGSSTLHSHSHASATATSPGGLMGNHNTSTAQPPTPSSATVPHHDSYPGRSGSTGGYFGASNTPHQSSYPAYSPSSSSAGGIGSHRALHALPNMGPPGYRHYGGDRYQAQPYSPHMQVPSMAGGPIMTNLNNPGGQMHMVPGALPSFGHPGLGHMYGQPQAPERPFKCDQCPQSFNRNHDLKRHKRIHLSVKPFPCGSCDKAFSRKDALKRHRLVKGCGGSNKGEDNSNDNSGRSDASASESPTIAKQEAQ